MKIAMTVIGMYAHRDICILVFCFATNADRLKYYIKVALSKHALCMTLRNFRNHDAKQQPLFVRSDVVIFCEYQHKYMILSTLTVIQ